MESFSSINRSTTTATTTSTTTSSSSSGSELFICFNTRRRLTTRMSARASILSPARDPRISLSTCGSSRRLRSSGSTTRNRGRSSPMFAGRGSAFDNPEPSSPKVTCIGQVRVKPKKKRVKIRSLPRRHSGEVSFRTLDQIQRQSSYNNTQFQNPRNQRWVHLPSSFNCLIPCKSPCVCENEQEDIKKEEQVLPLRRHILDEGLEIKDIVEEESVNIPPKNALLLMRCRSDPVKMDEEKSISVPPKNALLLMRCRSDPVKMEALVNRCWEPQLPKQLEDDDDDDEAEAGMAKGLKVSQGEENEQEETEDLKRLVVEDEKNVRGATAVDEEESEEEIEAMKDKIHEDESRVSYSNASFSLQSDDDDDDMSEADDDQQISTLQQQLSHVKVLEEARELETEYQATTTVKRETEAMKLEKQELPDSLLLMMCEPKLSMEVCKETWVCKREFDEEEDKVKKVSVESNATFPAAMIEHKLLNAAAYEPFVLTRCKSAPIRTGGPPDGWFWKTEGLVKHFRLGAPELVAFQLSR